jgi:hypothetical protein
MFFQKINSKGPKVNHSYISQITILLKWFLTLLSSQPLQVEGELGTFESPKYIHVAKIAILYSLLKLS